jgi:hypothetical protein
LVAAVRPRCGTWETWMAANVTGFDESSFWVRWSV